MEGGGGNPFGGGGVGEEKEYVQLFRFDCRSRSHAMREKGNGGSAANDSQFDLDDVSDHDMSSCSTTTSSDVVSWSFQMRRRNFN